MSPRPALRFLCLAGLLWAGVSAPAAPGIFHPESGRPSIRDFRPTEYRGHPQVYGVTQGTDRVIYLSTQEGITGFDGGTLIVDPLRLLSDEGTQPPTG